SFSRDWSSDVCSSDLGILRAVDAGGAIAAGDTPWHDFGRNGSFVVVRQLWQHVDRFDDYCRGAASEVSKLTREPVTSDWVAARKIGRGSSREKQVHIG